MAARSSTLGRQKPPALVFTVVDAPPAGETHILKSCLLHNEGAAADTATLEVISTGGYVAHPIESQSVPAGGKFEWNGWIVYQPGDLLKVYSTGGTTHFWCSGTKLLGVV